MIRVPRGGAAWAFREEEDTQLYEEPIEDVDLPSTRAPSPPRRGFEPVWRGGPVQLARAVEPQEEALDAIDATQAYGDDPPLHAEVAEEEEGTQLYTEDWLAVSTSRPPVPSFQLASSPLGQESSPVRQGASSALVTGAVEEEPLVATQMYSESPPEPQSPGAEAMRGQQSSPLREPGSPGAAVRSHQEAAMDPMTPIRRGPTCSKLQAALAAAGVPISGTASPCATQSYEEEEARPLMQEPDIKATTVAAADSPGGTQLYDDSAEPLTWSNPRKHQEAEAAAPVPSALNDSPPGTQLYEDVPLFQDSPVVAKVSAAPATMADSPCGTQNYDDVPSFWSGSSKATLTVLGAAVGAPDSSQGVAAARRGSSQAKLTVLGAPVGAPDSSPGPAATLRNRLQTAALACSALAESPPGTQLYEDVPLFQSSPASSKEAAPMFGSGLASSPGATQRQLAGDFQATVPSPSRQSPPMQSPPRTSPPHQSPGSPGATQLYEDSATPQRSPAAFRDQQEVAPQPISPTESICSANSLPAAPKGTATVTAMEEEELADTQFYGGEEAFQARATAFTADTAATQNYEDCEDVPEAEPADATGAAPLQGHLQVEAALQPGRPSTSAEPEAPPPTPEPEVEAEAPKSDLEEVEEEDHAAPPCAEAPVEAPAARVSPQQREEGGSGSEAGKDLVPSPEKAADCARLGRVSTVSTYSGSRSSPASAYSESRSASAQDVLREPGEGGCEATQLYGMDDDCLLEEPPKMATVDAGACSAPPPISKNCAEIFIEATQQYDTLIDHGSWNEMPAEAVQHNTEHVADMPAVREPESTQFYAATQFYDSPMKACTAKECPPPPPRRSLQAVAMEETQFYEEGFASAAVACTQLYSEDISPIKQKPSEKPLGGSPAGSSSAVVECTQLYSTQLYSEGDHVSPVKEKTSDRSAAGLALDCNVECTQLYSEGDHVSPVRERAPGEPSADLAVVAVEEPARPASPKPPSPCSSKPTPPSRPSLAEQDKAFQLPRARRRQGSSPPQTPAASSVKRPEITPARSPQRQALAQAAGGQGQSRSSTTPLLGLLAQAARDCPLSAPVATSVSEALQATMAASKAAASGAAAATVAAEVAAKRASTPCRSGRARAKKAPEGPAAIAASARAEPAPTSPGAGRNIRATASPSAASARSAALQETAGEAPAGNEAPPPTKRRRLSGKQSPPEPNPWATKVEEPDVVVLRAKPGRAPKGKRGQQAAVACKVEDDLTAIPAKSTRSKRARPSKPPSSQQTASQPSQAQRGSPGDVRDMALGGAKGARGAQPAAGSKQGVRRAKRERFVDDDDSDAPRQGGRSSAKSSRTAASPPQAPAAPVAVQPMAAVQSLAAQALVAAEPLAEPLAAQPCFVATGLDFAPKYLRALCSLGAEVVEDWSPGVTHLVADTFRRTTKFMCAICVGAQIVVPQYLEACRKASSIVDTAPYTLKDPVCEAAFAKKHALESYSLADALERARSSGPMLASYRVYCEPFVQGCADLKTLVEAAGGEWLSEASEVTADKRTLHIGKVYDAELLREAACTQVLRFNMYRL